MYGSRSSGRNADKTNSYSDNYTHHCRRGIDVVRPVSSLPFHCDRADSQALVPGAAAGGRRTSGGSDPHGDDRHHGFPRRGVPLDLCRHPVAGLPGPADAYLLRIRAGQSDSDHVFRQSDGGHDLLPDDFCLRHCAQQYCRLAGPLADDARLHRGPSVGDDGDHSGGELLRGLSGSGDGLLPYVAHPVLHF